MLSFHNGSDEIIKQALEDNIISVDPEKGTVMLRRFKNRVASCKNKQGYVVFTLHSERRIQAKAHRAVWISVYGLPCPQILDHKNRIKSDNRISNLRAACPKLNANNRRSYTGIDNPSSKINNSIANSIRADYLSIRSYSRLAEKYNVSKSTIANVIRKMAWNL